ncbi:MAG: hypothetical protein CMA12_00335 [Euryarchaeota archaeon]|nr:hypothetical protein [Euryarchaeota archaeon]|tara:strand:- start:1677 stop:2816 length:1140 start_codon:yes stop_codon:yes gene_type:complete
MRNNIKLTIENIRSSDNFNYLFNLAKEENFFDDINKLAVPTLNLIKIKNLIIAKIEKKEKKTKLISKPYRIVVDPTNACNLGCPLCPTGLGASTRTKKILKVNDFKKIVDQVQDYCIEIHLYNWGEPTLNKNLIEMLQYAKSKNIWSRISSNLSLKFKEGYLEDLLKSGLNLLHVDVDGLDQEVYAKYRRKGNLSVVIGNLKKIMNIKKTLELEEPKIEIAMLAMRQNEHQHQEFFKFGKELSVDDTKLHKIQHNPNMDEKWLPKNTDLIYKTYEGGQASSTSGLDNEIKQCNWPWSGIVINPDGGVNPCCIIDDPNSDFGNTNSDTISKIWNNQDYISARSEFGDKKEITKNTICNICKNQTHSKRLSRVSKSFAIKL